MCIDICLEECVTIHAEGMGPSLWESSRSCIYKHITSTPVCIPANLSMRISTYCTQLISTYCTQLSMHISTSLFIHTCQNMLQRYPAGYMWEILSLQVSFPIAAGITPFRFLWFRSILHVSSVQSSLHDQDTVPPKLVENVTASTPARTIYKVQMPVHVDETCARVIL